MEREKLSAVKNRRKKRKPFVRVTFSDVDSSDDASDSHSPARQNEASAKANESPDRTVVSQAHDSCDALTDSFQTLSIQISARKSKKNSKPLFTFSDLSSDDSNDIDAPARAPRGEKSISDVTQQHAFKVTEETKSSTKRSPEKCPLNSSSISVIENKAQEGDNSTDDDGNYDKQDVDENDEPIGRRKRIVRQISSDEENGAIVIRRYNCA